MSQSAAGSAASGRADQGSPFDLLVRNGTVIDGTRAPRIDADVGVRDARIVFIGKADDASAQAAGRCVDASGRIVAPGFIDCHTHDDTALLTDPQMTPKLSQGVTTVVTGNCGISLAPVPNGMPSPTPPPLDLLDASGGSAFQYRSFAAYLDALRASPPAINTAAMVGHTTLRAVTMSRLDRPANAQEIAAMRELVEQSLAAGAIGGSSGLFYEPAAAAPTEEVIAVFAPMREHGGIYCAHMRDESAQIIDSIEETLRIGRELGVTALISHHKVAGMANFGRSAETLPLIEQRMREQSVCLDCYPYAASSTMLSESRAVMASKVLIASSFPHPEYDGRNLDEVVADMGLPRAEVIQKLLPATAIYFAMHEDDVRRILAFPETMIGSDGIPLGSNPHPRLWGTFPRVLGLYSRELGLFPLETAVYKMTGLTARNFGLTDRGELRVGAFADITVFDAATVRDAADFEHSTRKASGIDTVIVNGEVAWQDGAGTGARPGRVLTRA
ncbi:MAG TPA: D-aminoacylase [Burkholderiaceae bacterium]|nr:D-aminoacylase [Burkholderiaceae bacterium]